MKTFLRRLEILNFLRQSNEKKTTEEIHLHLENAGYIDDSLAEDARKRLVQRDMQALLWGGDVPKSKPAEPDNDFGLIAERGQGKSLYWALDPYSNLRTDYEKMPQYMAIAFAMTEKHLTSLMPKNTVHELKRFFAHAEAKLEQSERALSPRHYQRLRDSIEFYQRGQQLKAANYNPEYLDMIYRAILMSSQLEFDYLKADGNVSEYRVHPLGVAVMLPKLYLVASKSGVEPAYRSFLLHKISRMVITQQSSIVPEGFNLKEYLEAGNMEVLVDRQLTVPVSLVIHLHGQSARSSLIEDLRENPISTTQTLQQIDGNQFELKAKVRWTIQLRNWLIALGPNAELVSPMDLRQDLASYLQSFSMRYC